MERKQVDSSRIRSVGFDDPTRTLTIEFKDGKIFEYYDVDRAVYLGLTVAESVGRYFNEHVKGKYRYKGPL